LTSDDGKFEKPITKNNWMLLGSKGLRNQKFLDYSRQFVFQGDPIEIQNWHQELNEFQKELSKRPSWIFGLNDDKKFSLAWISYQFTHGHLIHLISNMIMLLLFGAHLECLLGGSFLLAIYFLSGIFGGFGYFLFSQSSTVPVVGASAAIAGVMVFYMLAEPKQRVAFFYFLSPFEGHFGIIHLSKWFLIPLLFVGDFKDYFSEPDYLPSQIAVAAHIGGMIGGLVLWHSVRMILLLSRSSKASPHGIFGDHS
jgi:membrane associated rhomboid family serine protease